MNGICLLRPRINFVELKDGSYRIVLVLEFYLCQIDYSPALPVFGVTDLLLVNGKSTKYRVHKISFEPISEKLTSQNILEISLQIHVWHIFSSNGDRISWGLFDSNHQQLYVNLVKTETN